MTKKTITYDVRNTLDELRHACGAGSRDPGFRNYFCENVENERKGAWPDLMAGNWVVKGRVTEHSVFFHLTLAGCLLAGLNRTDAEKAVMFLPQKLRGVPGDAATSALLWLMQSGEWETLVEDDQAGWAELLAYQYVMIHKTAQGQRFYRLTVAGATVASLNYDNVRNALSLEELRRACFNHGFNRTAWRQD